MLSRYGMINLFNLFLLYLIMKWWIYDEKQLDNFIKVFIYATSFMALYGLFRWGLFGGDPANFYLNVGGQSVRITYFDGGQGLLFGVFFVILYNTTRLGRVSGSVKWFYYFLMVASLLNMLLSFRRTVWLGLLFVFIWIFLTSKASRKILIAGLGSLVLIIGAGVYQQRFDDSHKGLDSDLTDKSGKLDLEHGRFSEIARALKVANQHVITGLGPWGINSPRVTSWKVNDFVHSSIIHTYIKTGAIGGLLYLSLYIGYIVWWLKARKRRWHNEYYRSLGDAFFCGFLMEIPDIVFGTPLIIFRHTQILAIMLSMPFLCYKIDRMAVKEPVKSDRQKNLPLLNIR